MSARPEWLRPSMLPKLAECAHFRSDSVAGEAAARGTRIDAVFRAAMTSPLIASSITLDEDESEAVQWAVKTAKALAGCAAIETRESELKIDGWGEHGTADMLCADARWHGDLKSGQRRNYREQMAAYALSFMDKFFVDEWTAYLLFCDLREVETLRFTRDDAERCVREVVAKVNDPGQPPTLNDYCGWCANRFSCPVRRESLGLIEEDALKIEALDTLPSARLRDFVLRAKRVEEFDERAREILKERCLGGEKIPGVSITSKQGTEKAPVRVIELHWRELGTGEILAAYGPMSATKLRELWARKLSGKPFPDAEMERMPGSTFVRVSKPKA